MVPRSMDSMTEDVKSKIDAILKESLPDESLFVTVNNDYQCNEKKVLD